MNGLILKGIGGFYYVLSGNAVYECRAQGSFRNAGLKPLPGDRVSFEPVSEEKKTGWVTGIDPRMNSLVRPAVANVDQIFLLFSAVSPAPNFSELNRYLVSLSDLEIPVTLVVTKADIAAGSDLDSVLKAFSHTEYRMIVTSSVTKRGVDQVKEALGTKTTVFSGPSGVGKSSLLNALTGKEVMAVGELSKKIDRGKNTTRHAECFFTEEGAVIFDTPGFTSVDIDWVKPENLALCFTEMIPYLTKCRYPSCSHLKENGCCVKEAVESGAISKIRYESYRDMMIHLQSLRRY